MSSNHQSQTPAEVGRKRHTVALVMPIPDRCSDSYAAGWAATDIAIASGQRLFVQDTVDSLDDKARGFSERLEAEQRNTNQIVADCIP